MLLLGCYFCYSVCDYIFLVRLKNVPVNERLIFHLKVYIETDSVFRNNILLYFRTVFDYCQLRTSSTVLYHALRYLTAWLAFSFWATVYGRGGGRGSAATPLPGTGSYMFVAYLLLTVRTNHLPFCCQVFSCSPAKYSAKYSVTFLSMTWPEHYPPKSPYPSCHPLVK
jgi:hypothetical protein